MSQRPPQRPHVTRDMRTFTFVDRWGPRSCLGVRWFSEVEKGSFTAHSRRRSFDPWLVQLDLEPKRVGLSSRKTPIPRQHSHGTASVRTLHVASSDSSETRVRSNFLFERKGPLALRSGAQASGVALGRSNLRRTRVDSLGTWRCGTYGVARRLIRSTPLPGSTPCLLCRLDDTAVYPRTNPILHIHARRRSLVLDDTNERSLSLPNPPGSTGAPRIPAP